MKQRLRTLVRRQTTAVFIGLSLVVGLLAGLGGAAMIGSIELVRDGVGWMDGALSWGRFMPLLTVPVGLFAAWALAQRFPELRGSGVPETTAGLAVRSGYVPTRSSYLKILATALTLGSGGSAGREGPTVMVGGAIGSSIGRYSGLGEDQVRSLVAAGAGAGIGASFNAPIAGMLFAMEVILGNFAIRHLNAVVIASVTAAVTARSIVGEDRILSVQPHSVGDPTELVLYVVLGLLAAVVGFLFLKTFDSVHTPFARFERRTWLRPLAFGIPVAAIVTIEPRVLGTGQDFIQQLVGGGIMDIAWWVLLVLVGLKILATAGTLGSQASGGHFMPALFIGSSLGAAFAVLVEPVWGFSQLDTGAFAVVGMAAMFAAVARAPLTSILIVFELTGDYGLVLPLMLATSLSTAIADRIHKESVYTIPLVRRGIRLLRTSDVDLLDTVAVGEVMSLWSEVLRPGMTTGEVQAMLDLHRHHGLPVADDSGRLVGILTVTDILRTGGPSDQVTAAEAMTPRPVTVTPETPVSLALERMASLGVGRLPVVSEDDPTHLVGMFRRETAVKAYHHALTEVTETELLRKRQRLWTRPDAEFFEFHIPAGSMADGRQVKEVHWPAGCTLVAIRRGRAVLVPEGNTALQDGDIVTGFGAPGARSQVLERLRATAHDEDVAPGD
ncbi:MAG: chloride channel protein [Acidimicrobiia bacterium]|nr:chloride channel protein [Acidimicrobiia bacterium]